MGVKVGFKFFSCYSKEGNVIRLGKVFVIICKSLLMDRYSFVFLVLILREWFLYYKMCVMFFVNM